MMSMVTSLLAAKSGGVQMQVAATIMEVECGRGEILRSRPCSARARRRLPMSALASAAISIFLPETHV